MEMRSEKAKRRVSSVSKKLTSKKKALLVVSAGKTCKAQDPIILKIGKLVDYTDYFVIMHGESIPQVQAIFEAILAMIAKTKIPLLGIEGEREGRWVVIDWGDVVIHIFYKELRGFYQLEKLWADAPRVKVPETDLV